MATDFPLITVISGLTFVSLSTFIPPENIINGSEGVLHEHQANSSIGVNFEPDRIWSAAKEGQKLECVKYRTEKM